MRVLFEGGVDVEYTFISLQADDLNVEVDHIRAREGQVNGLCGAVYPGALSMAIGSRFATVPLRVELHEQAPPVPDAFEDVVETTLTTSAQDHWIVAVSWARNIGPLTGAGTYRARWCAIGMDEANDGTLPADHDPQDDTVWERYLLQLWPAPPAPDSIVQHGSARAGLWHEQASGEPSAGPLRTGPSKKKRPGNEPLATYGGQVAITAGRSWFLHDPASGTPQDVDDETGLHLQGLPRHGVHFTCGHDAATVDVRVEVYRLIPAFPDGWCDVAAVETIVPSKVVWAYSPPLVPHAEHGHLQDITLPDDRIYVRAAVNGLREPATQTETWLLQVWPNRD
jgi:hypothetical protein